MNFDLVGFMNLPSIDWVSDNGTNNTYPPAIGAIDALLQHGKKVFITAADAAGLAFTATSTDYMTDAAQAFFNDTLGVTLQNGSVTLRYNQSTGAYNTYVMKPFPGQPIGANISSLQANTASSVPTAYQDVFSKPTNPDVTPVLYSDGVQSNVVGLTYTNGAGARMVYLTFSLDNLGTQKYADSLLTQSLNWLNTTTQSNEAVDLTPQAIGSYVAMPSLFHGSTQINYTATEGERNVSFAAYDLLGRQIANLPVSMNGSNFSTTFDASTLPAGTYTIVKHSSVGSKELRVVNE